MEKINFENATLVKQSFVKINDTEYPVVDSQYSGGTNLDADTLNQLETNVENAINIKGKTLRIGMNNNQNMTSEVVTKLNYDKYLGNNFNDDYENYFKLSDGNIEIMNDNISCVIVVASVQLSGINSGNIYINKSGVGRYATVVTDVAGVSATAIIPVSKGSKINAEFYAGNEGQITTWPDMTFMEIVAI